MTRPEIDEFLPRLDPRELASRVNRLAGVFTMTSPEFPGSLFSARGVLRALFAQHKLRGFVACSWL